MVSNLASISWRSKVLGKMGDFEGGSKRKEAVRWEEYLPTTAIRVLLVESDDSTRQIVTALLRKCNFKVAAIHDGLKAWEILKKKHCNFDLILTEVDLPSISGFALLTLIMEHEYCKNIPVIMMSSNDSISIAFECLLKGATDFLIKPLRRNELKNLWQHVWRRISHTENGPTAQNLLGVRDEAETTFKDRGIRNCSDDALPSGTRKDQSDEKASDSQISCATDYLEYEDAYVERMQDLSHVKCCRSSDLSEDEQCRKRMRLDEEAWDKSIKPASFMNMGDLSLEESYEQTRQAIDLISTIDNQHELTLQQSISNCEMQNSSTNPQLDLSLSNLDVRKPGVQQKPVLPNVSAFSNNGNIAKLMGFSFNEKPQHPVKVFSEKESSPLLTGPSLHSGFSETSNRETSIEQKEYANGNVTSQSGNSTNDFTVNQTRVSMEDDIEHELFNEKFEERAKGARNFQREAALAKFRQKRKDRCYQKRVRYQSRKKQAEQRPRVKGQFVRQDQLISDADPA